MCCFDILKDFERMLSFLCAVARETTKVAWVTVPIVFAW